MSSDAQHLRVNSGFASCWLYEQLGVNNLSTLSSSSSFLYWGCSIGVKSEYVPEGKTEFVPKYES